MRAISDLVPVSRCTPSWMTAPINVILDQREGIH